MEKVLVYDIETLKECFLIVILIPGQKYRSFEVSKNVNSLAHFISFVEQHKDYYWVGYNNLRFDSQVVEWIIRNYEEWEALTSLEITNKIHQKAQDVIDDANYDVFPEYREYDLFAKQIDLFKMHHFDNKNKMVSLKRLEFEMDLPNIEEMPIKHDAIDIRNEDLVMTREYCINDVNATYQFYLITIGETEHPLYKGANMIELRMDIQEEFKIPCLNYSNSKIGDEIIKKYYCETKGIDYKDLPKKGTFRKQKIKLKHCVPDYIKFETKQLQDFVSRIKKTELSQFEDFVQTISLFGRKYTFAKGGIHSVTDNEIHEANEYDDLIDIDVSGYYPATIINNSYYPKHLGKEFLVGYSKVYFKRLELKPLAKKDKKIKGIVAGLKEAGNCPYGKSSEMTSWLHDKQVTLATCLTGELSILMLIEKCELVGIKCIMANTDGATFIVPKMKRELFNEIKENWRKDTTKELTYELEEVEFKKMIFSTVNDYIAIKTDGEVKKKGDFLTDSELHKNKSARIVRLALEQYFLHNIPVEHTIGTHTNIYDFCIRQKASKDFHYEGIKRATGEKIVYNKLIRYYISNAGQKLLKVKNPECTTAVVAVSQVEAGEWLATVCNRIDESVHTTEHINHSYYIERANRIIKKLSGIKKSVVINPLQLNLF